MSIKTYALNNHVPIIKDEGLNLLLATIKENKAKAILELGTAIGYSAINMAKLGNDILIDTIERDPAMYAKALENVEASGLQKQIRLFFSDIKDFVPDREYDLIFVDAAKAQYGRYLEQFYPYLQDGGCYFFDNMVFHNMIYDIDNIQNRNTRQLVKKICRFREIVQDDRRFDIIKKDDIGDGVWIVYKRSLKK